MENFEGFDVQLAPERLLWNSSQGEFESETGQPFPFSNDEPLRFVLVGAQNVWACWSDVVGKPLCAVGSEPCDIDEHRPSKGLLLAVMLEEDDGEHYPYFLQMFGISVKFGNRIIKLAQKHGPSLQIARVKAITVKGRDLFFPVADILDESSLTAGDGEV